MTRPTIAAALLMLFPPVLCAQELPLKREPPKVAWSGCPDARRPDAAPDAAEAERLTSAATEASILGDNATALDLLTRAAERNPASDRIAYRRARTLEALDRGGEAVAEYCRYLTLAPDAADAAEVRARIAALTDPGGFAVPAAAAQAFATAIAHYDAGRLIDAETALSSALAVAPEWGDALYDRGVVRLALRQEDHAADDLRRYLELDPRSPDFANVLKALRAVPSARAPYSPNGALATGLLVPGLGHFTTGRPVTGLVVLGAAAGAVAAGLMVHRVEVECLSPPVWGTCPDDQVLRRNTERPYLYPALGAAALVSAAGAVDAFFGAKKRNRQAAEMFRVGGRGAAVIGPSLDVRPDGVRVGLIRLAF